MDLRIRGVGLATALGLNAPANFEALRRGELRQEDVSIDGLTEKLSLPYFRIPDGAALFEPGRYEGLLLRVVQEALDDAKISKGELEELPIFLGSSAFSISLSETAYQKSLLENPDLALSLPFVGFEDIPVLLRKRLGIGGESFALNTACTSAANALMLAGRMLRLGRFPRALVLGFEIANRTTLSGFSALQLLAQEVRPFDRKREGIILGEGVGAVVLEGAPEADYALLEGASNCDPYGVTTANPDGSTIAALTSELLSLAGLKPEAIVGIKTHATASPMNDKAEAAGLKRCFERMPPLAALKPFLGHTLGACGVNELILMLGALREAYLPATPGFREEDPELGLRPLEAPWAAKNGVYLLNYFGFGGNNTALLLRRQV